MTAVVFLGSQQTRFVSIVPKNRILTISECYAAIFIEPDSKISILCEPYRFIEQEWLQCYLYAEWWIPNEKNSLVSMH